jgi:guanylate kinase
MYKIIALIGEAGSGKDRLMKEVLAVAPGQFNEIISCTTRPPREGEVEGVNYYFMEEEEFNNKILHSKMIEATNFNGWYYGTSYNALKEDMPNIGVFNPDGIRALLELPDIDLTVYRIKCSNKTRLLRQLNREQNPNVDEIIRRYTTDSIDFENLEFTYISLPNEEMWDLTLGVKKILCQHATTGEQGQNKLND